MRPSLSRVVQTLARLHDHLSRAAFVIGAAGLGLVVVVFAYEVTVRYAFGAPTRWANDTVSFLLLAAIFLASPWLARAGGHVAVTLVPDMLPSRASRVLRASGYLVGVVVCWWAGVIALGEVGTLYARGTLTLTSFRIPKWILTALIAYGLLNTGLYFMRLAATGIPVRDGVEDVGA